jgi:hypothetical protein
MLCVYLDNIKFLRYKITSLNHEFTEKMNTLKYILIFKSFDKANNTHKHNNHENVSLQDNIF